MRLVSWVSIVVIALGLIFILAPVLDSRSGVIGTDVTPYSIPGLGERFVYFGLATLIISEVFKCLKDTKSGGSP